ncbi:hypothetical protein [Paracoccus sp. (in: a-proteobacteria)]|jgi:hypothetical protein
MIMDSLSYLDVVIALIPAAIAASNPVVMFGLGTAAMLFPPVGF